MDKAAKGVTVSCWISDIVNSRPSIEEIQQFLRTEFEGHEIREDCVLKKRFPGKPWNFIGTVISIWATTETAIITTTTLFDVHLTGAYKGDQGAELETKAVQLFGQVAKFRQLAKDLKMFDEVRLPTQDTLNKFTRREFQKLEEEIKFLDSFLGKVVLFKERWNLA